MHELPHRFAIVLLAFVGCWTVLDWTGLDGATAAQRHQQLLVALTGLALLVSAWWRPLRMGAVVAALLAKLMWVALVPDEAKAEPAQLLALLVAGAILLREARLQARWNLAVRQEG